MKRSALVRISCALAAVICLGNWFSFFLRFTYEGASEWNRVSLFNIAGLGFIKSPSTLACGYTFQFIAIAAFLVGCLPFLAGFYGSVRPRSKALLPLSVTCSTLVLVSIIIVYVGILSLYGQKSRPIVYTGTGTYVAIVIVALETVAGVISRKNNTSSRACDG
jgi:hypothetical protein